MSRLFIGAVVLAQSFVSASAMAASPFLVCSSAPNGTAAATVQLQVSRPYNDSTVRVAIRELRDGDVFSSLNDLTNPQGHDQGLFQNQMFRLKVSSSAMPSGQYPAKIDFLYDSGVRASYALLCQKAR